MTNNITYTNIHMTCDITITNINDNIHTNNIINSCDVKYANDIHTIIVIICNNNNKYNNNYDDVVDNTCISNINTHEIQNKCSTSTRTAIKYNIRHSNTNTKRDKNNNNNNKTMTTKTRITIQSNII